MTTSGRLIRDEDPTGKAQTLSRTETDDGLHRHAHEPRGPQARRWEVGLRPDGDAFLEATDPSGAKTVSWVGIDGVRHQSFPTGETIELDADRRTRAGASTSRSRRGSCAARRAGRTQVTTGAATVHAGRRRRPAVGEVDHRHVHDQRPDVLGVPTTRPTRKETLRPRPRARRPRRSMTPRATWSRSTRVPASRRSRYEYDDRGMLRRSTQGDRSFRWEPDARGRPARADRRHEPADGVDLRRRRSGDRDQAAGRRHRALRVRRRGRPHRGDPARRPASRARPRRPRRAVGLQARRRRDGRART